MLLRELLRNYNWSIADATDSIRTCQDTLSSGAAELLIIDDSPTRPASITLRELQANPLTYLTPTICFSTTHNRNEHEILNQLGSPTIAQKPLTPEKFIPKLKLNQKIWSGKFYPQIRKAALFLINDQQASGLELLLKVNEIPEAQLHVAPALARFYFELGNFKIAEKVLLTALKSHPGSLNITLALTDIYMTASMPGLALRLLKSTVKRFPSSLTLKPDLIQAAIMKDELDIAIEHLMKMHLADFQKLTVEKMLAKCLYADGREHEIISSQLHNASEQQLAGSWEKVVVK